MNFPTLFIAVIIASIIGLGFHVIRGGRITRLVLYVITAWIGFLAGNLAGNALQMNLFRFGSLNLFTAIMGSILGLVLVSVFIAPQLDANSEANASGSTRRE